MIEGDLRIQAAADLTTHELYALLELRDEVFNLEQRCTANDHDWRDLEPDTTHYWLEDEGQVVVCLRVLNGQQDVRWIGRIATRTHARGQGLAGRLLSKAIKDYGDATLMLPGQSQLCDWYAKYGFVVVGDEFDQAGIPHREMVRVPDQRS